MKKLLFIVLAGCMLAACCEKPADPKVVAHRGYWKTEGSAQNSISSLQNAGRFGAYGSEFDVNLTADGQLVVNHDFTYHGLKIYETECATLRDPALTLKNGEIIPMLDEYFEASLEFPDMKLVYELKSEGDAEYEAKALPATVEAINRHGVADRIEFISFSLSACVEFARLMPKNVVEYLGGEIAPAELHEMGISGIDYEYPVFYEHPEWIEEAHKLGMVVNTWTVNNEEDMRKLLELGVDQITTNEPELAAKVIEEFKAKK